MCDVSRASQQALRPRWNNLYAVIGIAFAAAVVIDAAAPRGLASVLLVGTGVSGWVAGMLWIRANRVALDQAAWCGCAPETVVTRVITSEPRPVPEPCERPDRSDVHPGRRHTRERRRQFASVDARRA